MYAIVDIAGHQYRVEANTYLYVNRLEGNIGDTITLDKVLLSDADGTTKIGAPYVDGASISAKIVEHPRADKIIVFKKKRRKGYAVKRGHRQDLTKIEIQSINA